VNNNAKYAGLNAVCHKRHVQRPLQRLPDTVLGSRTVRQHHERGARELARSTGFRRQHDVGQSVRLVAQRRLRCGARDPQAHAAVLRADQGTHACRFVVRELHQRQRPHAAGVRR
jgi:hypothetical protein